MFKESKSCPLSDYVPNKEGEKKLTEYTERMADERQIPAERNYGCRRSKKMATMKSKHAHCLLLEVRQQYYSRMVRGDFNNLISVKQLFNIVNLLKHASMASVHSMFSSFW